jgi:hypothetical protein
VTVLMNLNTVLQNLKPVLQNLETILAEFREGIANLKVVFIISNSIAES